jgi:hypothetical protein
MSRFTPAAPQSLVEAELSEQLLAELRERVGEEPG